MSTKTWIWIGVVLLVGVIVYFLFIKKKSTNNTAYAPVGSYNTGTNSTGTLNLNDILVAGTGLVSALSTNKTTTTTNSTT